MNKPFVTVIIPCRNEEIYISECLDSFVENDYPKENLEILIIDGLSNDNTRIIVKEYQSRYSWIQLIDNSKKVFPSAVNLGVKASRGDFIIIAGSHARYSKGYISKCIESIIKYNADNVGGNLITVANEETFTGDLITTVLSSSFGVGNSTFRTGSTAITEVDTVFGGCYRREVFDRNGLFIEELVSTSDYEFNKRLRRNGGKILLVPEIKAYYYTRSSFKKFIGNNFRNGFWSIYPLAFVDYLPVSFRHLVPLLFLLSILGTLSLSVLLPVFSFVLFGILILYFALAVFFSLKTLRLKLVIFLPFFFFILHLSYGAGSFVAFIKVLYLKIFQK